MHLDFRRDYSELSAYLARRVAEFDPARHDGPGPGGPVTAIHAGYEYDQSGWFTVVFDTRPDAAMDGEWTLYIDRNTLARPEWDAAGDELRHAPLRIIDWDGLEEELSEGDELAYPLGELVRSVMLKARADGVFASLPRAPGCQLLVEHSGGAFGWPKESARGHVNLI